MAVQAQYPSNVLLLNNNRNGQEEHDYSLQPQPGLPPHPHMLCTNNNHGITTNSRKRDREGTETGHTTSPNVNAMNHFSLQSQPSHFIHLSHLHNQQQNVVSTGLRLSFDDQRLQFQQQTSQSSSTFLSLLSQGINSQIKQQQHELDQFLQSQGENVRRSLAEKRQRHYRELLKAAEETVEQRLKEKETEFAKATCKNAELEARAAQLTMEAQVWQARARAHEAAAASIQAELQKTIMCQTNEDGGGVISSTGQAEDAESAYIDPDRVAMISAPRPKCRGCGKRVPSVVVLPCRHLCICTECDHHFRACPVCLTLKNSTVHIFLS
ncbi:BOI-related E3 ubiquitin-protein ligase 1-like isoform X2 [Cicer arietinum]|uniref:Probable BOI-related E3 ubiquitin-protein ligase 2 isoform X2 n=1 Tax=Cicer arietinum TaxID=3827 RepID=A0A1S2YRY4_CICAR|nr:probable BOI-related E3 ubiquitin-protein ligase 2 isoform X2 [Cicer arietinum]